MCVHQECAWCQCQILVLAPAYPTLHKYAHSTSETSCVSTGNVRGVSAKYLYQHQNIQCYTSTPTAVKKLCVSTGNVRSANAKYWYYHQHIQQYTNAPTALQKHHVCPLGIYVVLVPNIGISTSIFNTTQMRPQPFRNFMFVHWECTWCQCQILVLAPEYPMLHKYAHSRSETSCVSTGNVRGASAKYLYQHQNIQCYTNTPTALQKLHVCTLGMCVVLVPNIGISTSISNTTQIRPQHFRNFMCVHWECAWCQCQILVLAPAYPTLHKYAHSSYETSCVSTRNVRGASAKYWYQHQHIQHYTNTPTALQKLHVCPLGMCVVLVPNICISTRISNATQVRPQQLRNFVCPLGMCVVLMPNIGIITSISNNTQMRPQHFRNIMFVHWEFTWCQCQILVLAPAYLTLHKCAHSPSETSCVSTGNVRGASAKYWYYHQHIQHYTNTPTALQKLHVCPLGMCVVLVPNICISTRISNATQIRPQPFRNFMCVHWECAWCQCQILVLAPAYPTLHKCAHSTSERSCVSTGNVRGASAKYWYQHQHIQHYTNTPTALQKLNVCPLGMCVVLVPNICISTRISNATQVRPQQLRNFMCVHWECAQC